MYDILFKYHGQEEEVIDTAKDRAERDYLLGEYRLAFSEGEVYSRRQKKKNPS